MEANGLPFGASILTAAARAFGSRDPDAGRSGTTQLVIVSAGFDTRVHCVIELVKDAALIEIDYDATHEYKKRRVDEGMRETSAFEEAYGVTGGEHQ